MPRPDRWDQAIERQLQRDADAWRDTVASGDGAAARARPRTVRPLMWAGALTAAAAAMALGAYALWPVSSPPEPTPIAVRLPTFDRLAAAWPAQPTVKLPDAVAVDVVLVQAVSSMDGPYREEARKLRADAQRVVSLVRAFVPGDWTRPDEKG